MAATTKEAQAVSARFVDDAVSFIDTYLQDAGWLRKNRKIAEMDLGFAHWQILGNSFLTHGEMERVKAAYEGKGWRHLWLRRTFHDNNTNWEAIIQVTL